MQDKPAYCLGERTEREGPNQRKSWELRQAMDSLCKQTDRCSSWLDAGQRFLPLVEDFTAILAYELGHLNGQEAAYQ